MTISVNYTSGKAYNVQKKPKRNNLFWRTLSYLVAKIMMSHNQYKIDKIDMDKAVGPCLMFSNHMYLKDFALNVLATYPRPVNNICSVDAYKGKHKIMEWVGCICKRKFTTDLVMIKSIKRCLTKYRSSVNIYVEARYTPIGTTAPLPASLGKLAKMMKVPLVIVIHRGNHLETPFWDYSHPRKGVPLHTTIKCVLSKEEVLEKSVDEINEIIKKEMYYDEYSYQKENNIHITEPQRARNLDKILYQCPHCKTEFKMIAEGIRLLCEACKKEWEMDELGELHANDGHTEFPHIPDWFNWEREQVRESVENGTYCYHDTDVDTYSLRNVFHFEPLGKTDFLHNMNGTIITGNFNDRKFIIERPAQSTLGLHVEYDYSYLRKEDAIDISTADDSFILFPHQKNVLTKLSFATEELYRHYNPKAFI